jgi:molybdenum cofactor cytidylyltransferase
MPVDIRLMMKIAGIMLAAGKSSRMGRNKLLLPLWGRTVLEESLFQLLQSDIDGRFLVLGFERERIESHISENLSKGVTVLFNENYELGRAESIKCAVEYAKEKYDAFLFMVADKPAVPAALIDRAIAEFRKKNPLILYVGTPSGRGHPIIFSKEMADELMALSGDVVGDELLSKYVDDTIIIDDTEEQIDIDTMEDYRRIVGTEES